MKRNELKILADRYRSAMMMWKLRRLIVEEFKTKLL